MEDFSGRGPFLFFFLFFFEFNFRPSVGAWLPATCVKQRLVYANGQGRDAVTAISLSLSLSPCLFVPLSIPLDSHISVCSAILNKGIYLFLYTPEKNMRHSNWQRTHSHKVVVFGSNSYLNVKYSPPDCHSHVATNTFTVRQCNGDVKATCFRRKEKPSCAQVNLYRLLFPQF